LLSFIPPKARKTGKRKSAPGNTSNEDSTLPGWNHTGRPRAKERCAQIVAERRREREEQQRRSSGDGGKPEESKETSSIEGLFDVGDSPHLLSTEGQASNSRTVNSDDSSDEEEEEQEQEVQGEPQGDNTTGPPSQIATTLAAVDSTSSIGSYVKSSISNGSMTSPQEHIASAVKLAGDLFRHKKFVRTDSELDFGGVICKKFCDKLEVQPSYQSLWWEMVKYSVRKAVDKKRSGASQAIKEEFMSKYSMQILEG